MKVKFKSHKCIKIENIQKYWKTRAYLGILKNLRKFGNSGNWGTSGLLLDHFWTTFGLILDLICCLVNDSFTETNFPKVILCADSMHSRMKLDERFPNINISSIENLYGHNVAKKERTVWILKQRMSTNQNMTLLVTLNQTDLIGPFLTQN